MPLEPTSTLAPNSTPASLISPKAISDLKALLLEESTARAEGQTQLLNALDTLKVDLEDTEKTVLGAITLLGQQLGASAPAAWLDLNTDGSESGRTRSTSALYSQTTPSIDYLRWSSLSP